MKLGNLERLELQAIHITFVKEKKKKNKFDEYYLLRNTSKIFATFRHVRIADIEGV